MDLHEKIRTLPTQPGVYLYKNAEGEVIYVGKANNLRSRVRSYLLEASQANAKTGSLMREAVDLDYILVANEHEALALENNLIKQRKPRFNILLRDDKTYPYVKLTLGDRFPKVFVTRRLRKDGSAYYGPYFPGNLAYRVVELIHRSFLLPSCKVDLSRFHPRACLQYYIHRCLGPCVEEFTTRETYMQAVRDAQLFLEGRAGELERALTARMMEAAANEHFEAAARLRDQLSTVHQLQEKQRIATAEQGDDADVFGYHFEDGNLAVNLFHIRAGKIVDRREFFWEELPEVMEGRERGNEGTRERGSEGARELGSEGARERGNEGTRELGNEGAREQGNEGARERGSEGTREQGNEGTRERGSEGARELGNEGTRERGNEGTRERGNEGTRERGNEGTRERGSEGARELGNEGTRERGNEGTREQGNKGTRELGSEGAREQGNEGTRERGNEGARERGNEGTRELGSEGERELGDRTSEETALDASSVLSSLLKQLYIDQQYVPRSILLPVDFVDREALATMLTERTGHRIEIAIPQRGEKRSLVDLAGQNAKQSYTQRFRVLEPSRKAIQEALADVLMLSELPRRIECFDISHIQGAETVASLVVWEDGKMNKSAYRKFKVMTVLGVDDFASMREVVTRRYKRILDNAGDRNVLKGRDISRADNAPATFVALAPEGKPNKEPSTMPSLILIDGGLGQLHAAAEALESLGLSSQPLASIAKKEEVIYLYGNEEEPVVLDRRSPVLHLVQLIRDESHRFAVGYHRQRRAMRDRDSELLNIPGVGAQTRQRLLTHFGSLRDVQQATAESLAAVVNRKTAETIWRHFHEAQG